MKSKFVGISNIVLVIFILTIVNACSNNAKYSSTTTIISEQRPYPENKEKPAGDLPNVTQLPKQVLHSKKPQNRELFGQQLAITADGTTLAVAATRSLIGNQYSTAIHIFKRDVANNWSPEPVTEIEINNILEIHSLAFTPDGNTLAFSETYEDIDGVGLAGSVQLISKTSTGRWDPKTSTTITSPVTGEFYQFGSVLKFTPDGKTLAIAELYTGIVRLYKKKSNDKWDSTPVNTFQLRSTPFPLNIAIAFNPKNNTLAIGDLAVATTNLKNVGSVQLFLAKPDGTWENKASTVFQSKQPGDSFYFGQALAFSPDGNSIAISEIENDKIRNNNKTTKSSKGGNVQLFIKNNNAEWNQLPEAVFIASSSGINNFGSVIAFNSSGTILAIGELQSDINFQIRRANTAGAVLIYLKDTVGKWTLSPSVILASQNPAYIAEFGVSFLFSPIDDSLIIGEPRATLKPTFATRFDVGAVVIYDSKLFQ